jgi:acyl-homoserine lactone synthase
MIQVISGEGGERGWRALARADGHERDAYDSGETIYLLAVEEARVIGGSRYNPTTSPHMISEVFPYLVEGTIPTGPTILEGSRFFVVRERRSGKTYLELMAAMQKYCLENGITHVTATIEMWWLPSLLEIGFHVSPLGLPQLIENTSTAAIIIEISEHALARAEQLMRLQREAA